MVMRMPRLAGPRSFLAAALLPGAAFVWLLVRTPAVLAGRTDGVSVPWAPALGLQIDLRLDALGLLLALLVTGVGALTLVYARWYFAERADRLGRTCAVLLLFVTAMVGIAVADNLLVLYVAWELTTVCSFLLIADGGHTAEARRAALRALLATTGTGFAMLLGFLLLGREAGTYRISGLAAAEPAGGVVTGAVVLILVGAFAKSAQVPFHPWLPAAMVAPTPVTAYLHAAAMVKAGVFLVARLAPALAETVPWQPLVVVIGLATMILGGWRALGQTDLKTLLAFGTIAQLGFLMVLLGAGTRTAAIAGGTMLIAHALFKACLFLVVGIIDHSAGTREIGELSGVGRRSPVLLGCAVLACASMVGLPPFVGYLGKEAALEAFHSHAWGGPGALAGLVLGSVLTVAYTGRFLQGAFAGPARPSGEWHAPPAGFLAAPVVLALAGAVIGLQPKRLDHLVAAHAGLLPDPGKPYHLALWHGFSVVVVLSAGTLVVGVALFLVHRRLAPLHGRLAGPATALGANDALAAGSTRAAAWVDAHVHARALPDQLARTVLAVVLIQAVVLVPVGIPVPHPWDTPWQAVVAAGALAGTVAVITLRRQLYAAVVLGVVGYLVAVVFVLQGAPDLALVQLLIETLTFVVFVLVLRRTPRAEARRHPHGRGLRAAVAVSFGLLMTLVSLTMASRHARSLPSPDYLHESPGHGGPNVVNVIITEYRALDTLGEVSVLVIAATAVAGLVLQSTRIGGPQAPDEPGTQRAEVSTRDG
ncbi:proton-conducting transporter membrane subunit [Janibacter cremeus]|uniref:hydrogen gas-evolving membrane-bound hydrogenase subunit E n=1 Tax=Janibacter cremeus TaxID=1285192 RepID=UPI0023F8198C|nr:hydrogen gas-evolving membrane-bound hydrogenase subunit E [Janibacter cremeus]WEV77253.1 proton-conducting transporter membrane subunit [Janibacter cremeus]